MADNSWSSLWRLAQFVQKRVLALGKAQNWELGQEAWADIRALTLCLHQMGLHEWASDIRAEVNRLEKAGSVCDDCVEARECNGHSVIGLKDAKASFAKVRAVVVGQMRALMGLRQDSPHSAEHRRKWTSEQFFRKAKRQRYVYAKLTAKDMVQLLRNWRFLPRRLLIAVEDDDLPEAFAVQEEALGLVEPICLAAIEYGMDHKSMSNAYRAISELYMLRFFGRDEGLAGYGRAVRLLEMKAAYGNKIKDGIRKAIRAGEEVVDKLLPIYELKAAKEDLPEEAAPQADAATGGGQAGKGEATPAESGQWSRPMSKSKMMTALGIDSDKTFNTFAKSCVIRRAGNRQTFQLRLDRLSQEQRDKLAKV